MGFDCLVPDHGLPIIPFFFTFHKFEVCIKFVTRVTDRHHEACRVIPNISPSFGIFYPHLILRIDIFSCTGPIYTLWL